MGSISGALVDDFVFNEHVDPKEFDLEFPPGTWVTELESPTTYIVREGGKRRTITETELRSGNPYENFLKTEPGELAPAPDTTNDPVARRKILAEFRRQQIGDLQNRSSSILVVRNGDVDVRVEPVGISRRDVPIHVAIDDASCDKLLFGKGRNEAAARNELTARRQRKLDAVDQGCRLTGAQMEKLELAGRLEISRFFNQADELRSRIIKETYDEDDVKKGKLDPSITRLCEETQPPRR